MLVVGTASPAESDSHTGVYLRNQEISRLVQSGALIDLPVKIEHTGTPVGKIVSAWQHEDRLDCVFRINDDSIESLFAQEFVKSKRCPEFEPVVLCYHAAFKGGYSFGGWKGDDRG